MFRVSLVAVVVTAVLQGCASMSGAYCRNPVRIDEGVARDVAVLGESLSPVADASNAQSDRWRVVAVAVASLAPHADFIYVDQDRLPSEDPRRGWPAPTVLVDGHDLFGMAPPVGTMMGCRAYPGGVPGMAEVEQALRTSCSVDS